MLIGTGAALAYLFDPEKGVERRERLTRMWEERTSGEAPRRSEPEPTTIVPTPEGMRRAAKT